MRCYPVSSAVNSCEETPFAGGVARRLRQAAAVGLIAIFAASCAVSNRIALPPLPQVDVLVLLQASLGPGGAGQAYPAQTISTNLTITSTAILSACGFVSPPGTAPGNNVVPRGLQITVGTPPGGATNTGCTLSGRIDPAVTPGTYVFTVRAADNNAPPQTDDETYSIVISSLAFTLGANPAATVTGETFSVTWTFTVVGSPANPNQSVLVELVNAANVVEDSCTAGVGAGGCGGLASPAVGNKTIRLTYPAPGQVDANFPAGGGTSRAHTVTAASTTTTITADAPDPSVTGQQYTVNITVAPVAPGAGAPTGSVSVSDGLGNNCVSPLTAGANQSTGSCILNGPTAGARTLTASYAGDANYSASMGTNAHTVNPAPTTTTITSDVADPSVVGQAYTINVTVDVNAPGAGTPTGVVAINDGQGVACNAALVAGPAANQASGSCSLTSVTTAANLLTANYPGDANFAASADTEAHAVTTASTTTTITSDLPDPSVSGESYLVNFTVASVAPGMGEPTGNVTADDGAGQSCVGALTPGAPGSNTSTGSCALQSASATGPGPAKTVTATYGGDANFSGSIGTNAHTVNPANTATVVVSSSALVGGIRTSEFQEAVTFAATVTINAPGGATPIGLTGVVDFVDITTSTNLCTGVAVTAGMASCMVSNLAVGIHSVEARYDAANTDLNFNSSTGGERQQVVPAATQTAVVSSSNPSEFQETVTFTATITVPGPGSGSPIAPSGTVTFFDGAVAIVGCAGQAVSTSQATCTTAALSVSGHNITASYSGDGSFAPSTSPVLLQTVNPAATATAVTSAPDPSDFQQAVTLTATVTVPGPGSASPIAPTGAVQFFDGGVGVAGCAAQPLVAGQANCVTSTLAVGASNITATFSSGDGNFLGSTSPVHVHTVNMAGTTTTITNAVALAVPSVVGELYTVSFSVTVNPPGGGTPTGTVTVSDGLVNCIATLPATSCMLASTTAGNKTLTASYGGDGNFAGSTSAGVAHTVNMAGTTTTIINPAALAAPSPAGQPYAVDVRVDVNLPGSGNPTGTVTVTDGTDICTVVTLTAAGPSSVTGSCNLTSTIAGAKLLTATYNGDANYNASAPSAAVPHTVNLVILTTPAAPGGTMGDATEGRLIGTGTLGVDGVAFEVIGASGGVSTCVISSGALPLNLTVAPGMTSTPSDACVLVGTPAAGQAGTFNFTIMATDGAANTAASLNVTLVVQLPLIIASSATPGAAVDQRDYTFALTASGGFGTKTFDDNGTALATQDVDCTSFSIAANGGFTATPAALQVGDDDVCAPTLRVQDMASTSTAAGSDTQALSIPLNGALNIATAAIPNGKRQATYNPTGPGVTITAVGGTGVSLMWTAQSNFTLTGGIWMGDAGTACEGLQLPQSPGGATTTITGIPVNAGTLPANFSATCSFTMQVDDASNGPTAGANDTQPYGSIIFNTLAFAAGTGTGTIEVVNTDTNASVASIGSLSATPDQVDVSPDGRYVFATSPTSDEIVVIDVTTGAPVGNSPFDVTASCNGPAGLATTLTSTGTRRIFVACSVNGGGSTPDERVVTYDFDPTGGGALALIATADYTGAGGTDHDPQRLAITPDGNTVFVTFRGSTAAGEWGRVNAATGAIIQNATNDLTAFSPACGNPLGIAIAQTAAAGNPVEAYVACATPNEVAILDAATLAQVATNISVGAGPDTIAFVPGANSPRAYVSLNAADQIAVVDTNTRTATNLNLPSPDQAIDTDSDPRGVTIPVPPNNAPTVEVFTCLSGAAAPSPGVNVIVDPATAASVGATIGVTAGSAPRGIAHMPIPR